ncbi:xanthine dehydrogenase family protein molybdopterin-binding subunit [Emcibacter sp. SYSU 3D8]|uniref:xanthine dehydrogenase family protein molybdopterin-binding subunit n=1 Tax=Emcibacter sp. SYSU 3D8 TaxID=3133969 RepID=UPI0031FE88F4
MNAITTTRRGMLALCVGAGTGLVLGFRVLEAAAKDAVAASAAAEFNPFVRIDGAGTVTVIVKHLDKGQGSATGLASLVAEELNARPEQVVVEFAPSDSRYKNLLFGMQGTGGSSSMANSFDQYREAGAAARQMLAEAAAAAWKVPAGEVTIEAGELRHASGKRAGLGAFAEAAGKLPVPPTVTLKKPEDWIYIGKSFPRVDAKSKSEGSVNLFAMDLHLDGMLVAVTARPPKWGATLRKVDSSAAKEAPGVVGVLEVPQGVVVLASTTWQAIKGRELLKLDWDESAAETRSSDAIFTEYRALADTPGVRVRDTGDAAKGLKDAARVVEATYEFPYLAHAPMEPINVTVLYDGTSAKFWSGSQFQAVDHMVAAKTLGLPAEKIAIVTMWAGGSFGRRAIHNAHYFAEAATIAKAWGKPQPIKLVYTREDDIRGGYYRPAFVHKARVGLDAKGNILGWEHRIVGQSILKGTAFEAMGMKNGIDDTSIEGISDMAYANAGMQVDLHTTDVKVPVLWWRSVGHTHTAYVMETMIDELATAAGIDPVAYRLRLMKGEPRKVAVLKLAAEKAGWAKPAPEGRFRGVAVHHSFGTYVAEIAEVSVNNGKIKVEKVVCAVDCGVPVNPDNIAAQMEGGIGFGLGAILHDAITLKDGAVEQGNFDGYKSLRITEMPAIEVHVVPSTEKPSGVGEPGVPPIGPAVANAVFKATGKRVRELPFARSDLV